MSQLSLNLPAGRTFTSYKATVYGKCDTGSSGYFLVSTREMTNGHVKVYFDGAHKTNLLSPFSYWRQYPHGPFEVIAEFFPTSPWSLPSSVNVMMYLTQAPEAFEMCLDKTMCLNLLGDHSEAAWALRNVNPHQKNCLEENDVNVPAWLLPKCTLWRQCVAKNPKVKKFMKGNMRAAGVSRGRRRRRRRGSSSLVHVADEDECFDPATGDLEAWACECMEELQAACGEDESCYKNKFCAHNKVCNDWKVDNACPGALLERRSNTSVAGKSEDALQDTLKGKCVM